MAFSKEFKEEYKRDVEFYPMSPAVGQVIDHFHQARTTISMDRTLNFVNVHWGRILNPNNATHTHTIFVKL